MSSSSSAQQQQLLDLGSLDSSALPDLTLNTLHDHIQPRLSLELGPTDLSFSLPDISANKTSSSNTQQRQTTQLLNNEHGTSCITNQSSYDLSRHGSKRWTSFSELGKSVLRLKSFERSTIHGSSSPYLRPRINQIKSSGTIYSSNSTSSNHRHLFKLFHQEHLPTDSNTQSENSNQAAFTLPNLPPLSESLSTSFDKELSSIVDQQLSILEEPLEENSPGLVHSSPLQRAQSIISSQSDPIVNYASSSSVSPNLLHSTTPITQEPQVQVVETEPEQDETCIQTAVVAVSDVISDNQDMAPKSPIVDEHPLKPDPDVVEDEEGTVTHNGASIEILNRSDESQSNEEEEAIKSKPVKQQPQQPPITTTTTTTTSNNFNQKTEGTLGRKKKFSSSSNSNSTSSSSSSNIFKKLLFLKGLTQLKSSPLVPNNNNNNNENKSLNDPMSSISK